MARSLFPFLKLRYRGVQPMRLAKTPSVSVQGAFITPKVKINGRSFDNHSMATRLLEPNETALPNSVPSDVIMDASAL